MVRRHWSDGIHFTGSDAGSARFTSNKSPFQHQRKAIHLRYSCVRHMLSGTLGVLPAISDSVRKSGSTGDSKLLCRQFDAGTGTNSDSFFDSSSVGSYRLPGFRVYGWREQLHLQLSGNLPSCNREYLGPGHPDTNRDDNGGTRFAIDTWFVL